MTKWQPFQRGELPPVDPAKVSALAREFGQTEAEVRAEFENMRRLDDVWVNNRYQVNIRRYPCEESGGPTLIHLSIKRRDKNPCHDWRDFQRIKNELVGPEYEGVELYPAESRLVDTSNQYHLWVIDDPTHRWPFGFNERLVQGHASLESGAKQRAFEIEEVEG